MMKIECHSILCTCLQVLAHTVFPPDGTLLMQLLYLLARPQGVSSTALRMVSVGQVPPDFKLNNQNDKPVSLSSFKNKKKVVVRNRCS